MERTPIGTFLEFIDGLLKIEDKLIVKHGKDLKAVEDIMANTEQLRRIQKMAKSLLPAEREAIEQAYSAGMEDGGAIEDMHSSKEIKYDDAQDYFTTKYGTQ